MYVEILGAEHFPLQKVGEGFPVLSRLGEQDREVAQRGGVQRLVGGAVDDIFKRSGRVLGPAVQPLGRGVGIHLREVLFGPCRTGGGKKGQAQQRGCSL